MKVKLEYLFWPGEMGARATEKLGATALSLIKGTAHFFDSKRLGEELEANHTRNELDTIGRDIRAKRDDPEVVRLDARRIVEITKKDFLQRVKGGSWLSPDYIAIAAKNMAEQGVPADAMLETLTAISEEPPSPQLPEQARPDELSPLGSTESLT